MTITKTLLLTAIASLSLATGCAVEPPGEPVGPLRSGDRDSHRGGVDRCLAACPALTGLLPGDPDPSGEFADCVEICEAGAFTDAELDCLVHAPVGAPGLCFGEQP